MLRIKLIRSPIGNTPANRGTVAALGLRKLHQTVEHNDTPTIRGMIQHARHMLEVTEVEGEVTRKASSPKGKSSSAKAAKPAKAAPAPKAEKAAKPAAPKAEKVEAEAAPKAKKPAAKATTTTDAKPKRTTKKTEEEK